MKAISMKQVHMHDEFWSKRQQLVRDVVIPYQWEVLNDRMPGAAPSHAMENFRIAAGEAEGEYAGAVFQDTDFSKWLETVGFALSLQRDEALERIADEAIDLVGRAQQPDGYLNTYFTVKKPDGKWTNLRDDHELYTAGHFIEAAVAYYRATGKRKVLDIACSLADCIAAEFGAGATQRHGYDGHPEIELALVKLYQSTGNRTYLELSKFFVDERGRQPHFFDGEQQARTESRFGQRGYDYFQSHLPVREQTTAEGHAVRAVYLYSGMADLAAEYDDRSLLDALKELWRNTTRKRMYITGGIGSSAYEERFTVDYDLPNERAYTESCAAIGLVFWANRMLQLEADGEYADVMERALYNGLLSGISLDGTKYFYVNPLEVWPSTCEHRNDMNKVKGTRQPWFACACCPPNIARLLLSLGQYMYGVNDREVYVHLYASNTFRHKIAGAELELVQQTAYPWRDKVLFSVSPDRPAEFTLALRLPAWCKNPGITVNGEPVDPASCAERGYAKITRTWQPGDKVELTLPMPVEIVRSHPALRANAGAIAVQRGPVVYCLEEADNGANLRDVTLSRNAAFSSDYDPSLLDGVVTLKTTGWRSEMPADDELYTTDVFGRRQVDLTAIPYYAWANREAGEMLVWIREQ
ncbi:glycoside hydrolase family 127 protein [Paenibacillus xerothermodurans]|uniref:Glycoside hydrolase family 127 protein n=1 Tax=Paenibacillus xerothermodurans TaxID=1977292 RepID=A0A2W1N9T1_PAEXE|nr:beta-L-arabinofuranosidase domain-containing protein [Paenibacillus xerothermodurans]PZE21177.1 glycoside hydrolase family 127 protein [Paenibacillus xerothermodurans]